MSFSSGQISISDETNSFSFNINCSNTGSLQFGTNNNPDRIEVLPSGIMSFNDQAPRTAIAPSIGDDLCNKTYVDSQVASSNAATIDITNTSTNVNTFYPTFVSASGSTQTLRADTTGTVLSYVPSTSTLTATNFDGLATNSTNVGITNASSTVGTFYPAFTSSTSGYDGMNVDTGLTFTPSSNTLTTGTFSGALNGTAVNSTNSAVTAVTTNAVFYPSFVSNTSGNRPVNVGTGLTFNPSTNNLSTTTFTGSLVGNASTATSATSATSATNASNVNVSVASSNAEYYPTFVSSTSGNNAISVDSAGLTFNPSTNVLSLGQLKYPSGATGQVLISDSTGLLSLATPPIGPIGPQGETGPQGSQGLQGPQGATGPQGLQGLKGDTGDQGPQGATGATGPQGPQGPQGIQGIQGLKGDTGDQGPQGLQGNTGPQGDTGPQGLQGPQGATGAKGDAGVSSFVYNYQADTNSQAPPVTSGHIEWNNATQASSTHLYVSHIDGLGNDVEVLLGLINAGDVVVIQDKTNSSNYQNWNVTAVSVVANQYIDYTVTLASSTYSFANNNQILFIIQAVGPEGPQGPAGPQGPQGIQGPQGATGPQGPQGIQGLKGDTGDQGPQGIQGLKGDTGNQGPQGLQGLKGDTGNQGPQGLQGPQGSQGIQGPQGDIGPQGATGASNPNSASIDITDTNTSSTFYPTFVSSSGSSQVLRADVTTSAMSYVPSTSTLTCSTFVGALTGNASSSTNSTNTTNVNITDTNTNSTFYPVFASGSGNQALGADISSGPLSYNPQTANLTSTTFTGALVGNADSSTNASNVVVTDTNVSGTYYPTFVSGSGNRSVLADIATGPLTYNPSTSTLTATTFAGNATTATTGTNVVVTEDNTATTYYPVFTNASGSSQALRADTTTTALSYTPSTSVLSVGSIKYPTGSTGQVPISDGTGLLTLGTPAGSLSYVSGTFTAADGSNVALTSGVTYNAGSITLTAGTWLLSSMYQLGQSSGNINNTFCRMYFSTTTSTAQHIFTQDSPNIPTSTSCLPYYPPMATIVTPATTTTYYLLMNLSWTQVAAPTFPAEAKKRSFFAIKIA